ncbi:carbonic anhydrase family protein [Legionella sp. CNM-4043-24]|uniref:carbonic anhydrase family protein n=1 Tax=Legionella sp. CNM-4043-24 TaxID=3421646 RepID=UPI00403AE4F6
MNRTCISSFILFAALTLGMVGQAVSAETSPSPYGRIMTESKQQNMTPDEALQKLKDGNKRFLSNTPRQRDYLKQAKLASYGQFPFAVVLNCMDSRSIPELVFDQGLADLFTIRIAGNVLNPDIVGSMEFATEVVGARLIVVLGHTSCGAMSGACSGAELGDLTQLLDKIKPVVKPAMKSTGLENCTDPKLIDAIASDNATFVANQIQESSPIIKNLVSKGQIKIVAGMHDIKTGEVRFLDAAAK